MVEQWENIPEYIGLYQISNLGRVKSLKRESVRSNGRKFSVTEKILKSSINSKGYEIISLTKNNKSTTYNVHIFVAICFLNHVPNGHILVVNHINFIKSDNRATNLEIISHRENSNFKHIPSVSSYTGVYFDKKWRASIWVNNKREHLGRFNSEIDAHNAYQEKLKTL